MYSFLMHRWNFTGVHTVIMKNMTAEEKTGNIL